MSISDKYNPRVWLRDWLIAPTATEQREESAIFENIESTTRCIQKSLAETRDIIHCLETARHQKAHPLS